MKENAKKGEIVLYTSKNGDMSVEVQLQEETVWLSQKQMAQLFGKDTRTVNEHIKNIYKERELEENPTIRNFRIVQKEGERTVERETNFYNLDVIISVGYRVKSQEGTHFRIWATRTLRDHILKGFTINKNRLQQNGLQELQQSVALIEKTLSRFDVNGDQAKGLLDIITNYTNTWLLLQQYDESALVEVQDGSSANTVLSYATAKDAIAQLKQDLMDKNEATELFGQERADGLDSILSGLNQTFDGKEVYPTIESKAAHILYLVIKNHPFSDGNKRSASLLFILFLQMNDYLFTEDGERKFNDNALVALALLIAQSDPAEKEQMIRLTMHLIQSSH
jgi:death-on-curing family protein